MKHLRQRFVDWLLQGLHLRGVSFGEASITMDPGGVDVIRWSGTQAAVGAGDIGMDAATGRPQAFIAGASKLLASTTDAVPTVPTAASLTAASAQYTVLATDTLVECDVSGGALSGGSPILMNATPTLGARVTVKNTVGDASIQPILLNANGKTMEDPNMPGVQTYSAGNVAIKVRGAAITWAYDGAKFVIVASA